jgi:hypothetical protein
MKKLDLEHAKDYILAGKALVTFHNTKTGNQQTYLIRQKKDKISGELLQRWYVTRTDMRRTYLGFIDRDQEEFWQGADITEEVKNGVPMKVWEWVWKHIIAQDLPDYIEVLRSDFCGRCGRELTEAHSLNTGIGPECRRKLGIKE